MVDESEAQVPDWIKINKSYNDIDELMDHMITDEKMNFLELSIVMMMAKEKLDQEKINIYLELAREIGNSGVDDKGLYR